MKTIQVLLLMAMGWLALPVSASAWYNPSSGMWVNRDPLAYSHVVGELMPLYHLAWFAVFEALSEL